MELRNLNNMNDLRSRALEDPTCTSLGICTVQGECISNSMIRVIGDRLYIKQVTGGSYGSDLFYVPLESVPYCCFVNVRELARRVGGRYQVLSTSRGGRRKWEEIELPRSSLEGKAILYVTFSNSGYALFFLCRLGSGGAVCCKVDLTRKECLQSLKGALCRSADEGVVKFYNNCRVEERIGYFKRVLERYGVTPWFGGARLSEVFSEPELAFLMSLVIDTPQGRAISLGEKIAHVAELWVLAKILDVLGGKARQSQWLVASTLNRELVVEDRLGRPFTLFYQGSVKPHLLKMATGVEEHVVPDIVVVEGEVRDVGYGRLAETLNQRGAQAYLVVEVKTGLELAKWRRAERVREQVKSYQEALRPRHTAVVTVCGDCDAIPPGVNCVTEDRLEKFIKEVFEL